MSGKSVTFNVFDFIEAVRTKPFLYDKSDDDYKNNDKRQQTWDEIALQFAFPDGKEMYKKWKYFKDHYFSEKKKMSERGVDENNGNDFKKWPYYDSLKWVDGFIEKRTTPVRSGVKRPKKEIVEQSIPSTLEECIANALTQHNTHPDFEFGAKAPTSTVASERENDQHTVQPLQNVFARHRRPFGDLLSDEPAAGGVQDASFHRPLAAQTEEELFGQLIARDLARLPAGVRSLARLKIQELLYHFSVDRFPEIRA